ncbi:MAG: DUF3164 family protein [Caulobacteraceae bacterium]
MDATTETRLADAGPGQVSIAGRLYMADAKGALVPVESVKAQHKLEDELVRKIASYAEPLAAEIARFRAHTFEDVDAFVALMEQQYRARGGAKGNLTFTTYDGLMKVQVQVADQIVFGAELQIAKGLVDECLTDWSEGSRAELRAIVHRAFNVDQAGRINRGELLSLLRLEIADPRWLRAMEAIRDSIRVVGSKRYVRIYRRDNPQAPWRPVAIDVAAS